MCVIWSKVTHTQTNKLPTWGSSAPAAAVSLWTKITHFLLGLWSVFNYLSQGAVMSTPSSPSPPVRAIVHNVTMVTTETMARTISTPQNLLIRQRFPELMLIRARTERRRVGVWALATLSTLTACVRTHTHVMFIHSSNSCVLITADSEVRRSLLSDTWWWICYLSYKQ